MASCSLSVALNGRYQCDPPAGECPDGFTCQPDGYCGRDQNAADAATSDAASDGGVVPDGPPLPDAPPNAVTVTFGERPTSLIQGVTFDTELDAANPTANFGGANEFFCDNINDASGLRYGLIRFDLTAIPSNAHVLSASLELWTGTDPLDMGVVRWFALFQSWDEGSGTGQSGVPGATFNQRVQGTPWTEPGAAPPSSGTTVLSQLSTPAPLTGYAFVLPISLVQGWVSSPGSNFGMICVVSTPAGQSSDTNFKAKESTQVDHRPELTITYVP